MTKFTKRTLGILLSTAMLASVFTGCTTKNPAADSTTGTKPADSTAAADNTTEAPKTDWPRKSIQMIVSMGAGGDTDFNARTYAKYLEQELGQSVVVTNITGNGGAIGSEDVKNSAPDGYKALFYHTCLNINQATGIADYGSEAFETVAVVGKSSGEAVVVRKDAPYNSMSELIQYTKDHPDAVKIAANTGATSHWASVVLQVEEDAAFNIVNTSSSAERVAGLLGGHLDVIINPIGTVQDYIKSGDFKYLAVTTPERLDYMPDVPTCKEQGVDLAYTLAYYVMFPKGTPKEICDKFAEAFKNISEKPEYAEEIKTAYNQTPYFLGGQEAIDYIQQEHDDIMKYAPYFKKS